jgi:hypothetical protein
MNGKFKGADEIKGAAPQAFTVGFRSLKFEVPAIQNEINNNPAIHASQRPGRMKKCYRDLQFLVTDITNAADRHYRKSGNNPLTRRENTNRAVKFAITQLFNNKTFAAEFVSDPMTTSNKVIKAIDPPERKNEKDEKDDTVKDGGIEGISALLGKYRHHERGRFLAGVPIKRM